MYATRSPGLVSLSIASQVKKIMPCKTNKKPGPLNEISANAMRNLPKPTEGGSLSGRTPTCLYRKATDSLHGLFQFALISSPSCNCRHRRGGRNGRLPLVPQRRTGTSTEMYLLQSAGRSQSCHRFFYEVCEPLHFACFKRYVAPTCRPIIDPCCTSART